MKLISTFSVLFLSLAIISESNAQSCSVNAGLPQTICTGTTLTLRGTFPSNTNLDTPPQLEWVKLSGPSTFTPVTSSSGTSPFITTASGLVPGNYVFQVSSRCNDSLYARNNVAVTVLPAPPTSLAGPDVAVCTTTPITLAANAVSSPNTGTWSATPAGGTFSNVNSANAVFTPPAASKKYTLTWTITNGAAPACPTSNTLSVSVIAPALTVSAGPTQSINCKGNCITLAGSDPGLAPQTGLWTVVSGPNTPVFSNATKKDTIVCGLAVGVYVFRWTVTGACKSGSSTVTDTVKDVFAAPVAEPNVTYTTTCATPAVGVQVLTGRSVIAGEKGVWTQTGGGTPTYPNVTFSPFDTVANPSVSGLTGTFPYTFRWTRTNTNGCSAFGTHTVYRNPGLIMNLSTPPNKDLICDDTAGTFTVSYTDAPTILNGLFRNAILVSKPPTASIVGVSTVSTTSTVSSGVRTDLWNFSKLTKPGTYVFQIEYRNGCGSAYSSFTVNVSRNAGAVNPGSNIIRACNITTASPVGSLTSPYAYNWSQVSGPAATLTNTNTLNPGFTTTAQGVYVLRLNNFGGKTCSTATSDMSIVITKGAPTTATVSGNATICAGRVRLSANTPIPLIETGTWTVTPAAGITFLPNKNVPNAVANGLDTSKSYTFKWTIANQCSSNSATEVLTTTKGQAPPAPDAGTDQCIPAATTTALLNGNSPGAATITWTPLDAGASLSSTTAASTTATLSAIGTYRFEYALSTTGCSTLRDTVLVTRSPTLISTAGIDTSLCVPGLPATFTLTGNTPPAGFTGTWTQVSGPSAATIGAPTNPVTGLSNLIGGLYEFRYTVSSGGVCSDATSSVKVQVTAGPSPALAGADQNICSATSASTITLAATAPTTGTGFWSVISGPAGSTPTFSNAASNSSTFSNLSLGGYSLSWTTTNGTGCPNKIDTVNIGVNVAAAVKANFSLCNAPATDLIGNANSSGTWSTVSVVSVAPVGTASPTISSTSPSTAIASGLLVGTATTSKTTYTFRYSIPAATLPFTCPATSADLTVTVYPQPSAAVILTSDTQICYNVTALTLRGVAPTVGTGSWNRTSGPNTPGSTGTPIVNLTNLIAGRYVYTYSVTTAGCPSSTAVVAIVKGSTADAGVNQQLCNSSVVYLNATPPVADQGTWSNVSGPAGYAITNVNAPNTSVTGLVTTGVPNSVYVFRWTIDSNATSKCPGNFKEVTVQIDAPVPTMNAGNDTSFCQGAGNPFPIGTSAPVTGVIPSYVWTPNAFLSSATVAKPLFNGVNNAGSFIYTVTGTNGTCQATSQVVLTAFPKPTAIITAQTRPCPSIFVASNAGQGVKNPAYSWSFGSGATPATSSVQGPVSVSYPNAGARLVTLTVSSSDGCVSKASDSVFYTCAVLPLKLLSFSATWRSGYTALAWKMEQAPGLSNYTVERSADAINFSKVGSVANVPFVSDFTYADKEIPAGKNRLYYRLKIASTDGTYLYSNTEAVNIAAGLMASMSVIPNPAKENFTVGILSENAGSGSLTVVDMMGRRVYTKEIQVAAGTNNYFINDLKHLSAGVYQVHFSLGNERLVQKVVLKRD